MTKKLVYVRVACPIMGYMLMKAICSLALLVIFFHNVALGADHIVTMVDDFIRDRNGTWHTHNFKPIKYDFSNKFVSNEGIKFDYASIQDLANGISQTFLYAAESLIKLQDIIAGIREKNNRLKLLAEPHRASLKQTKKTIKPLIDKLKSQFNDEYLRFQNIISSYGYCGNGVHLALKNCGSEDCILYVQQTVYDLVEMGYALNKMSMRKRSVENNIIRRALIDTFMQLQAYPLEKSCGAAEYLAAIFSQFIGLLDGELSPREVLANILGSKEDLASLGLFYAEPLSKLRMNSELVKFNNLVDRKATSILTGNHDSNDYDNINYKSYANIYTLTCQGQVADLVVYNGRDILDCKGEDGRSHEVLMEGVGGFLGYSPEVTTKIVIASVKKISIQGYWFGGISMGMSLGKGGAATIFPYIGKFGSLAFVGQYDAKGLRLRAFHTGYILILY